MRAALDQRVAPLAQRGHVDVDPIFPPVDHVGVKRKCRAFIFGQRFGKQLHVLRLENLFVVQNKWLVELDQFFDAAQVALLARKAAA